MNDQQNQTDAACGGSDLTAVFGAGTWVASDDQRQPSIAQVQDCYVIGGEALLDLVIYRRDGTRIGRVSPPCGGPRNFEPACPVAAWGPIEEPDWEYLAVPRYEWGDRVRRIKVPNTEVTSRPPTGND